MNKHNEPNSDSANRATSWTTPIPRLTPQSRYRYGLLLALAVLLAIIILPRPSRIPSDYSPGDIATRNVKAPRDLLVQDQLLTEQKRNEAYERVEPLYDYDSRIGEDTADRLTQAIIVAHVKSSEEARREIEGLLALSLNDPELETLKQLPADDASIATLRSTVIGPYRMMVVADLELFNNDRIRGVVIRDIRRSNEETHLGSRLVISLSDLRSEISSNVARIHQIPIGQQQALLALVGKLVRTNLSFNRGETELRRQQAADAVKPVLFQIKRGEMIVREGDRITEEQIRKLRTIATHGGDYAGTIRIALGLMLFIILLFFTSYRYGKVNIRKFRLTNHDLLFISLTFVAQFLAMKVALVVAGALDAVFPSIDLTTYYYLFPFAVGTILVRIVLNSEVALVFNLLSALLLGVQFGSLPVVLYATVGGLVGAHWVRHCKERSIIYRAGFRLGIVSAVTSVLLQLLAGAQLGAQTGWGICFAFASGIISAGIVTAVVPLVESLFRYTTDIKLLELANMNNPVLRELMVQAPGTYHHSVIVGNLVEAAAEAINANPLLARVAAYYHDIGKAKKPLYFIENIRDVDNKHDKLSPSMSSLILISHVKDGVEMAREHRLGSTLIDIIQQHHGTALMKFFYEKARQQHDAELPSIDEREYRYPGPKPQTREAALIMLADAVEAASRTLSDPTPARIQGMVQKIINNIFIDGQLAECELTLKDLHLIAKSFNRVLAGIYHHRVDYPEPAYKESSKRKSSEHPNREPAKEASDQQTLPAKGSAEDLKRLGMS